MSSSSSSSPPSQLQPFVSTRISIRWPPEPASEPTDTIVLTGRSKRFIDLRMRRRVESEGSREEGGEKGEGEGEGGWEIDWATAGEKVDLGDGKSLFTNEIDFRYPSSNPSSSDPNHPHSQDIGHFTLLPNGDEFETGSMPNPLAGGAVQAYEEVWRNLDLKEGKGGVRCVMLMQENEELGRGYLGRIGRWEVGIRDSKKGFFVRRWEKEESGGRMWREVNRIGEGGGVALPRIPEEGIGEKRKGEVVEIEDLNWVVLENS